MDRCSDEFDTLQTAEEEKTPEKREYQPKKDKKECLEKNALQKKGVLAKRPRSGVADEDKEISTKKKAKTTYSTTATTTKRSFEEVQAAVVAGLQRESKPNVLKKLQMLLKAMQQEIQDWSDRHSEGGGMLSEDLHKIIADDLGVAGDAVRNAKDCDEGMDKQNLLHHIMSLTTIRQNLRNVTYPRIKYWCDDPLACMNCPYDAAA